MVPLDPFLPLVPLEGGCEDAANLPLDKRSVFIRMLMKKISVEVSLPSLLEPLVLVAPEVPFFLPHIC
jgi:hypothetical protein